MLRGRNSAPSADEQPHIGNYRLLKTIGKGNFAKVKLARHILTGKEVSAGTGRPHRSRWGDDHSRPVCQTAMGSEQTAVPRGMGEKEWRQEGGSGFIWSERESWAFCLVSRSL